MKTTVVSSIPGLVAVGPYNLARVSKSGMVYLSGQIGSDAEKKLVTGGTVAEFKQIMQNVPKLLAAAGSDLAHVLRVTVYLADMADYAAMNEVYAQSFVEPYPVRTTVQISKLPLGAHVELEITAEQI